MSSTSDRFPWRVIAIAVVLLGALVLGILWMLGPPGQTSVSSDDADVPATEAEGGEAGDASATPAEATQNAMTPVEPPDPSTPEGRAAMAALRAQAGTMDLQLFLIVPGLERLVAVEHTVAAPATLDAQVRRAVEELIGWTGSDTLSPVTPDAHVRETWVSPGGIAYVDFARSFYDSSGGGSLGELHAVYGIVSTVTESFPEIVAVQFLLEGEEMETLAGHIDLSRPLLPSDEWVLIETGRQQLQPSDAPS